MSFQSRSPRPPAPTYPPEPSDPAERARVQHTRLRRRILYDQHYDDAYQRLVEDVGPQRAHLWGTVDLMTNPLSQIYSKLSVLYEGPTSLTVPPGGEDTAAALDEAGHWSMMARVQRDTLALREMLLRVSVQDSVVNVHPVFPDMVSVKVDPRSGQITRVEEWAPDPDQPDRWVRLVHDISGIAPLLCVWTEEGKDCTERVLGSTFEGEAYPYRDPAGNPLLPYVVYHAARTGAPFDPYTDSTVVDGSLRLSVLYTFWNHALQNASWRQRYASGVEPAGMSPMGSIHAQSVGVDPSSVVIFNPLEEGGSTATVGTFETPSDIEGLLRSIQSREARLVSAALGSADVSRSDSEIRSGYSLAVSREAQREAQRAYEPLFRRSDLALIKLVSSLMGGPTSGWGISYSSIPRDPQEAQGELDRIAKQLDLRLIDRVGAWLALHPGASEADAITEIAKIDAGTQSGVTFPVGFVTEASALAKSTRLGEIAPDQARAVLTGMIGLGEDSAQRIAPDGVIIKPTSVEGETNV